MIPKKRTPLTTKKASLRTHIETNRAALAGRKTKPVLRVYQNKAGETFTAQRTYTGRNTQGKNERNFSVSINKAGAGTFATAHLQLFPSPKVSAINGREIYIFDVATSRFHANPDAKKGRDVFGMVVDECKELGKKEFGNNPFNVTLLANNKTTAVHYHSFGFELLSSAPLEMFLRVN